MREILSNFWSWLKPKLTALFTLTCKSIAKEVLDLLNDAELQQKALTAVKVAAASGLKGNAAFDLALDELKAELKAEGRALADNLQDTLIQNAYCVFKNSQE